MKEILTKLRTENRYTQDQIARMLGITRQSYIKYEAGDVEPTVEMVRKLSRFYSVPYEVLIDNDITPKSVSYPDEDKAGCCAAEPATAYGTAGDSFSADYFAEQLNYLSSVIASMQKKLMLASFSAQHENTQVSSLAAKPLDKEAFFAEYGDVQIDGSFVDEWRQMSLI